MHEYIHKLEPTQGLPSIFFFLSLIQSYQQGKWRQINSSLWCHHLPCLCRDKRFDVTIQLSLFFASFLSLIRFGSFIFLYCLAHIYPVLPEFAQFLCIHPTLSPCNCLCTVNLFRQIVVHVSIGLFSIKRVTIALIYVDSILFFYLTVGPTEALNCRTERKLCQHRRSGQHSTHVISEELHKIGLLTRDR